MFVDTVPGLICGLIVFQCILNTKVYMFGACGGSFLSIFSNDVSQCESSLIFWPRNGSELERRGQGLQPVELDTIRWENSWATGCT